MSCKYKRKFKTNSPNFKKYKALLQEYIKHQQLRDKIYQYLKMFKCYADSNEIKMTKNDLIYFFEKVLKISDIEPHNRIVDTGRGYKVVYKDKLQV